jgi:hypothetical protein
VNFYNSNDGLYFDFIFYINFWIGILNYRVRLIYWKITRLNERFKLYYVWWFWNCSDWGQVIVQKLRFVFL